MVFQSYSPHHPSFVPTCDLNTFQRFGGSAGAYASNCVCELEGIVSASNAGDPGADLLSIFDGKSKKKRVKKFFFEL